MENILVFIRWKYLLQTFYIGKHGDEHVKDLVS